MILFMHKEELGQQKIVFKTAQLRYPRSKYRLFAKKKVLWTTYNKTLIVRDSAQQGRTRITHLRTELYSDSFHAL